MSSNDINEIHQNENRGGTHPPRLIRLQSNSIPQNSDELALIKLFLDHKTAYLPRRGQHSTCVSRLLRD